MCQPVYSLHSIKKIFKAVATKEKSCIFAGGEMAEWSIAAVLKTVDPHGSGGSNPSLSAAVCKTIIISKLNKLVCWFFVLNALSIIISASENCLFGRRFCTFKFCKIYFQISENPPFVTLHQSILCSSPAYISH